MAKMLVSKKQFEAFNALEQAAVRARGVGYKAEFQSFLSQLKSGGVAGKADDVREAQAKRLWDLGLGRECKMSSFEEYLATIPEIPEALLASDENFPLLVLVDSRVSLTKLCELANVKMFVTEDQLVPHDDQHKDFTAPIWIRIQNGKKNRGKSVRTCRSEFRHERGLTAFQGVAAVIQHPEIVADWNGSQGPAHALDLPGSVDREDRGSAAYLGRDDGQLRLHCIWNDSEFGGYGSASRRE